MIDDLFLIMLFVVVGIGTLPFFEKFSIPWPAALIAIGFLGSELVTFYGVDLGLRWYNIRSLFIDILIPIIIYEAVLRVNISDLRQSLTPILLFSFPCTIAMSIFTGIILFYVIGNSSGFPLVSAIAAGALLSITNPIATINLFVSASNPLRSIVVGESLFNSIVAISFFWFCLDYSMSAENNSIIETFLQFIKHLFGGLFVGVLSGALSFFYTKLTNKTHNHFMVSLILCFFTAYICKALFGVEGITAVFISALFFNYLRSSRGDSLDECEKSFALKWGLISYIASVVIFTLMGVSITINMFTERWLAMLIAIITIILVRYLLVYLFGRLWLKSYDSALMALGGVRGMAVVALAISLPTSLPGWWTIQSIAYAVVLFSILIQSPLLAYKIKQKYS